MYNEILDTIGFVSRFDPEVGEAMQKELGRQQRNIELIASEICFPCCDGRDGQCADQQICRGISGQALLWWLPIC